MIAHYTDLFSNIPNTSLVFFVIAFLAAGLSMYLFANKQTRWSLFVLFLCSLFLGFAVSTIDPFLRLWDEQFHALVGKHLSETPLTPRLLREDLLAANSSTWVNNHIWLHKQPLSLWQIALSIKLFGANYLAVRIPSIVLHALLVFIIYRIGKLTYNTKVGFYAAFLFTFLHYPLTLVSGAYTAEHVDVAFMFYITASIWCWLEYTKSKNVKWIWLMGLFSGIAVLSKWLVGLLVYAGVGIFMLKEKNQLKSLKLWKNLIFALLISLLIGGSWQLYCYFTFPEEFLLEMNYNALHFTRVVEGKSGGLLFYWHNLNDLYGGGLLVPWIVLASVIMVFKTIKDKSIALFVFTLILVPYLFFTIAQTKMPSFCVIVSPLVILVITGFFQYLVNQLKNKITLNVPVFISVLVVFFISVLLFSPNKTARAHLLGSEEEKVYRKQSIKETEAIKSFDFSSYDNPVVFNTRVFKEKHKNISVMFYHDLTAYNKLGSVSEYKELIGKGYTVILLKEKKDLFSKEINDFDKIEWITVY